LICIRIAVTYAMIGFCPMKMVLEGARFCRVGGVGATFCCSVMFCSPLSNPLRMPTKGVALYLSILWIHIFVPESLTLCKRDPHTRSYRYQSISSVYSLMTISTQISRHMRKRGSGGILPPTIVVRSVEMRVGLVQAIEFEPVVFRVCGSHGPGGGS
jgi:hypothetical protein